MKGIVGALSNTVQSGFQRMQNSFSKVYGKLESVENSLAQQREKASLILEVVTDVRYKTGIEKIEAAYNTLMKGSHNMKSTLGELKGFIYELNTENSQNLNSKRVKEYLKIVRKEHGKEKAEELGYYILTVKAEFLLIVSLHYTSLDDYKRVSREYEDFNREAMEIVKHAGLADMYDGETQNGLKHGKGGMFYKSGAKYEGDWVNDVEHGNGEKVWSNGAIYVGEFKNGDVYGTGRMTYADEGGTYEGEFKNREFHGKGTRKWTSGQVYDGHWINGKQHGFGKEKWTNGHSYEGEHVNGVRSGKGVYSYKTQKYEGEFLNGEEWGQGTMHWDDGGMYKGEWVNGCRQGKGKMTYASGDTYDGPWMEGKRTNRNARYVYANGYTMIYQ